MVAELEGLLGTSATTTPEGMWRSRILMTSAQDSDRDLQLAIRAAAEAAHGDDGPRSSERHLRRQHQQQHHHQHHQQVQASRKKLQRDFGRVHLHLQSVLADHQRRQLAEVSLLTAAPTTTTELRGAAGGTGGSAAAYVDPHDEPHPHRMMMQGANSNKLQEEKEEFFDRAMRERQEEVRRISQSMRKVQEIYTVRTSAEYDMDKDRWVTRVLWRLGRSCVSLWWHDVSSIAPFLDSHYFFRSTNRENILSLQNIGRIWRRWLMDSRNRSKS